MDLKEQFKKPVRPGQKGALKQLQQEEFRKKAFCLTPFRLRYALNCSNSSTGT